MLGNGRGPGEGRECDGDGDGGERRGDGEAGHSGGVRYERFLGLSAGSRSHFDLLMIRE